MKTSFPKPANQNWYLVDAAEQTLGRLCTRIAVVLRGRHRPSFVPHYMSGDHVVVINAEKVRTTGAKDEQKKYYRHSGFFGNLREIPMRRLMRNDPAKVLEFAVKGMLPKNASRQHIMKNLHVYAGAEHKHEAQKPQSFPQV